MYYFMSEAVIYFIFKSIYVYSWKIFFTDSFFYFNIWVESNTLYFLSIAGSDIPSYEKVEHLRTNFEKLLQDSGVKKGETSKDQRHYNMTVNKIFENHLNQVRGCSKPEQAKHYYDICKNFAGTTTILSMVETHESWLSMDY